MLLLWLCCSMTLALNLQVVFWTCFWSLSLFVFQSHSTFHAEVPRRTKEKPCTYRLTAQWQRYFCSEPLGVQLEYIGSWILGSISGALPWKRHFMTSVATLSWRKNPEFTLKKKTENDKKTGIQNVLKKVKTKVRKHSTGNSYLHIRIKVICIIYMTFSTSLSLFLNKLTITIYK